MLYYGDLHFHTRYSDNADRAPVAEMVAEGKRRGLAILGTGDHNHNLTAESWSRELADVAEARRRNPDIVLLANCEITFLMGHFLVLEPAAIDGTIAEGYRFLLAAGDPGTPPVMVNHPGLPTDDWNRRLIPGAVAMEVINAAVIREASRLGMPPDRVEMPFGIPSLVTFGRYLLAGVPVSALGSSDAHRVSELGFGVTGFWVDGPLDGDSVREAIRSRRTFAATDTAVRMEWGREPEGAIWWKADFASGEPVRSWLMIDDRSVAQASDRGRLAPGRETVGNCAWVLARCGERFAVSSALPIGPLRPAAAIRREAAHLAAVDRALLDWRRPSSAAGQAAGAPPDLELFSASDSPIIRDAGGRAVPYRVLEVGAPLPVIDKRAPIAAFAEFEVWLQRNEVHECRFERVRFEREGDSLRFEALLLPALLDKRPGVASRYRAALEAIRALLPACATARLRVSLMQRVRLRLEGAGHRFPLRVQDAETGLASEVHPLLAEGTLILSQLFV